MRVAALFFGLMAMACSSNWEFQVAVVQPTALRPGRVPVMDAQVILRCPGEGSELIEVEGTSDEQGRVILSGPGTTGRSLDCSIVVNRQGYVPENFSLKDICTEPSEDGSECAAAEVQTELRMGPKKPEIESPIKLEPAK